MNDQTKVTGVILAGGLARRMNNQDKGLILFKGQPLVSYALKALTEVTESVLINANRNIESYQAFGYPVIPDQTDSFDGPLAGVLTAMINAERGLLLIVPCDSPMLTAAHLQTLLSALIDNQVDVAVAFDGARLHPVFLAIKTTLQNSLQSYLAQGERKVEHWLAQQDNVKVDFSQQTELFININSMPDLLALEDSK